MYIHVSLHPLLRECVSVNLVHIQLCIIIKYMYLREVQYMCTRCITLCKYALCVFQMRMSHSMT